MKVRVHYQPSGKGEGYFKNAVASVVEEFKCDRCDLHYRRCVILSVGEKRTEIIPLFNVRRVEIVNEG